VKSKIIVGTRGSKLALWQAGHIADRLRQLNPGLTVELRRIVTTGDRILDVPLAQIGGKGLFTKELELAMLAGEIDLAVHSLKDMPTELPPGLVLAATTERMDPLDAFISPKYQCVGDLPQGATVGTSSLRRKAQLLRLRPDLNIVSLRGNLDTRLQKLDDGQFDAIVLAAAGLRRLGWSSRITDLLSPEDCLPAVGQGVLAIETRVDDPEVLPLVAQLDDAETRACVTAERKFLDIVQGGCQAPIGVFGRFDEGKLVLKARILSLDGTCCVEGATVGDSGEAANLGQVLAEQLLNDGARQILAEIGLG
jgi:hydroxymethylbilane synthase